MSTPDGLRRQLGTFDAVTIGPGSMIGAGIFVALGPAAAAAGTGLLIGLGIAAIVAYCNATSSARLAALYPQSGGTYVYGKERLGGSGVTPRDGASSSARPRPARRWRSPSAYTCGRPGARGRGGRGGRVDGSELRRHPKSALLTRVIVAVVLAVLVVVVVVILGFGDVDAARLNVGDDISVGGVLQSAGLLFFAFAGYARIATLGEEVRDPAAPCRVPFPSPWGSRWSSTPWWRSPCWPNWARDGAAPGSRTSSPRVAMRAYPANAKNRRPADWRAPAAEQIVANLRSSSIDIAEAEDHDHHHADTGDDDANFWMPA